MHNNLNHLAIIMDGNGRWAGKNDLPRSKGHMQGLKNIENICEYSIKNKINNLSLFALSTENFMRPKIEVEFLVNLVGYAIDYYRSYVLRNKIIFNLFGSRDIFNDCLKKSIIDLERDSLDNVGQQPPELRLNIAFNYSGRQEIIGVCKSLFEKIKNDCVSGLISNYNIEFNEQLVEKYLFIQDEPDLIIRTGGHQRLSNFFLWQSAYSELYFCDQLWPDFNEHDFNKAVNHYKKQKRNFGLIDNFN